MTESGDGSPERLAARRRKLDALRADGIEPFPHEFDGVEPISAVRAGHAGLSAGEETDVRHRVAGRLAARRGQGKMAFLDVVDRSGRIQLQARVDELGTGEMDRLRMNQEDMRRAAEETQGRFLTLAEADRLPDELPAGTRVTLNSPQPPQTLWNQPAVYLLVLLLLGSEWLLRKRERLL